MAQYWREYRRGFRQPYGREERLGDYDWVYRRGRRPGRDQEFRGGYGRAGWRGRSAWEYGGGYGAPFERGRPEPPDTAGEGRYGRTPSDRWPEAGHEIRSMREAARRMDDEDIREAVLENLFHDEWIDPDRIEVEVDHGVVRLMGDVDDFMEARYAWDDAWETVGVRGVINNLTVRTDVPHRDMDLPQARHAYRRRMTRGGR